MVDVPHYADERPANLGTWLNRLKALDGTLLDAGWRYGRDGFTFMVHVRRKKLRHHKAIAITKRSVENYYNGGFNDEAFEIVERDAWRQVLAEIEAKAKEEKE